jgi:hypothetical protein
MTRTTRRIGGARTVGAFLNGRACSDTLFYVLVRAFGHTMKDEERAVMPLAGGIMQHGYQCGMLWGSALAAGAQAHRLFGPTPEAEHRATAAAQGIVRSFRALNDGHANCSEITNMDDSSSTLQLMTYFLLEGGSIDCFRMSADYAPRALEEIEAALGADGCGGCSAPVSCAAQMARKAGATQMHAVMAAGLAGGIGLSGGACGALGAAVWLLGLGELRGGARKLEYKSPKALALVDRFMKSADYELECSRIVGRTFEDALDHAGYLREGGCAALIEVLASA